MIEILISGILLAQAKQIPFVDMGRDNLLSHLPAKVTSFVEYSRKGKDLWADVWLSNIADEPVVVPRLTSMTCYFQFTLFGRRNKKVSPTTENHKDSIPYFKKYEPSMVVSLPPGQTLFQRFKFPGFYPTSGRYHGYANLDIWFSYPLIQGKDFYKFNLRGPKKSLP